MLFRSFYRDPEEVEKQQQEEAAAKAAAAAGEQVEAPLNEWDTTAAPTAGGINPALVAGEGMSRNAVMLRCRTQHLIPQVRSTGLRSPLLLVLPTGQQSPLLPAGPLSPRALAAGTKGSPGCLYYACAVAIIRRCLANVVLYSGAQAYADVFAMTRHPAPFLFDAKLCTAYDQHDMLLFLHHHLVHILSAGLLRERALATM